MNIEYVLCALCLMMCPCMDKQKIMKDIKSLASKLCAIRQIWNVADLPVNAFICSYLIYFTSIKDNQYFIDSC